MSKNFPKENTNSLQFINKKAEWFIYLVEILRFLNAGNVPSDFKLIDEEDFKNCDQKGQTQLLKQMLIRILAYIHVSYNDTSNVICPWHNDEHASMVINIDKYNLHCFACMDPGKTIDLFDIVGSLFNITDFKFKKNKAIELFVANGKEIVKASHISFNNKRSQYNNSFSSSSTFKKNFTATKKVYVDFWEDADCLGYLNSRGIDQATAVKFNLKCWNFNGTKYLVIPCDNKFYYRRKFTNIENSLFKIWNPKSTKVSLFLGTIIESIEDTSTIFVFESAIDAITAYMISKKVHLTNFSAIALNGIEHSNLLLEKKEIIIKKKLNIVIMFDNDEAGKDAASNLYDKLLALKIKSTMHIYKKRPDCSSYLNNFKDLNDAYCKDNALAAKAFKDIYNWDISRCSLTRMNTLDEHFDIDKVFKIKDSTK